MVKDSSSVVPAVAALGVIAAGVAAAGIAYALSDKNEKNGEQQDLFSWINNLTTPENRNNNNVSVETFWKQAISSQTLKRGNRAKEFLRSYGIPQNLRRQAWLLLIRDFNLPAGTYQTFLQRAKIEKPAALENLEKDIHRTFPSEPLFQQQKYLDALNNVLSAFIVYKPDIEYCQGMNFVVGALLAGGVNEEEAFKLFVYIVDVLLPSGYYSHSLSGLRLDLLVLSQLIQEELPTIAQHFRSFDLTVDFFATAWFLCLFTNTFSLQVAVRFLDSFLYEGSKSLFRVSLGLLRFNQQKILKCNEFSELFLLLRELPNAYNLRNFDQLVKTHHDFGEISTLKISQCRAKATEVSESSKKEQ